jgi:hypothetical protein
LRVPLISSSFTVPDRFIGSKPAEVICNDTFGGVRRGGRASRG